MSTLQERAKAFQEKLERARITIYDYEIDLVPIIVLAFFMGLPIFNLLPSSLLTSFAVIFMITALALAWNIIEGFAGYPDFGLAAYFGAGAYILTIGLFRFDLPSQMVFGFPISVYILIAVAFVLLSSIGILFAPLMKGRRPYYFAFSTLIVFEVIAQSFAIIPALQGYTPGSNGWPVGVTIDEQTAYFVMLFALFVITFFVSILKQSKIGYGFLTMKEDFSAARSLKIPVNRLRILAMGLYAGFVAVIGALYAMMIGWISPSVVFRIDYTILPIAIVFAGGPGNVRAVFLAALLVLFVREGIQTTIPDWSIALFGVFIIVLSLVVARGGLVSWVKKQLNSVVKDK